MTYQTLFFTTVAVLGLVLVVSICIIIERNGRIKRMAGQFAKLRAEVLEEFNVAIYAGVTPYPDLFRFESEDGPDGETFLRVFLKRPDEVKLVQVFLPADVVGEEVGVFYSGLANVKVRVHELDPIFDKVEAFIKEAANKSKGVR